MFHYSKLLFSITVTLTLCVCYCRAGNSKNCKCEEETKHLRSSSVQVLGTGEFWWGRLALLYLLDQKNTLLTTICYWSYLNAITNFLFLINQKKGSVGQKRIMTLDFLKTFYRKICHHELLTHILLKNLCELLERIRDVLDRTVKHCDKGRPADKLQIQIKRTDENRY